MIESNFSQPDYIDRALQTKDCARLSQVPVYWPATDQLAAQRCC